jgi:hypothetical protein
MFHAFKSISNILMGLGELAELMWPCTSPGHSVERSDFI